MSKSPPKTKSFVQCMRTYSLKGLHVYCYYVRQENIEDEHYYSGELLNNTDFVGICWHWIWLVNNFHQTEHLCRILKGYHIHLYNVL